MDGNISDRKMMTSTIKPCSRACMLLLVITTLAGCGKYASAPTTVPTPRVSAGDSRVMIRSGSLSLRVKDVAPLQEQIEAVAHGVGGRVENWSVKDNRWLWMTLRVPEPALDESMDQIAALGNVVGRSLQSRDVTEELVDLETRLTNLRALRERLRAYLGEASDLKEILAVERELARVQTEIETIEAKLKILKDKVTMSTLKVTVRKKRGF